MIYHGHNATTPVLPEVSEAMQFSKRVQRTAQLGSSFLR
jgi:cysteine sulfinate desulfinase/cysteine desulfurase-like protein